jgi:hypothetical protein
MPISATAASTTRERNASPQHRISEGESRMMSIGYLTAWSLWMDGEQLTTYSMWGLPFIWWARIGKLMQFAAGLTVLLDLAGPERLQVVSGKLGAFDWQEAAARMKRQRDLFSKRKEMARIARLYRLAAGLKEKRRLEAEFEKSMKDPNVAHDAIMVTRLTRTAYLTLVAILFFIATRWDSLPMWQKLLWIGLGTALFLAMKKVPVFLVQAVGTGAAAARSAYAVVIFSMAASLVRALGEEGAGHPLRWFAFVLFLTGFHLDLLGS